MEENSLFGQIEPKASSEPSQTLVKYHQVLDVELKKRNNGKESVGGKLGRVSILKCLFGTPAESLLRFREVSVVRCL